MGLTMKVIVDTRRISMKERLLLIENALNKTSNGEIVVLADDDSAREDISHAAGSHGWILKGIEVRGDCCWITITPKKEATGERNVRFP
jgi:hypothetical protein